MKPMKLTDVGSNDTTVEPYLTDASWLMQQKLDGARMIVHATLQEPDGRLQYVFEHFNGSGTPMSFSAAKQKLSALEMELSELLFERRITEVVLDGELIIDTGVYWVFDVLKAVETFDSGRPPGDESDVLVDAFTDDVPLSFRMTIIDSVVGPGTDLVRRSPTAWSEQAKREMWEAVKATGVEGAVSKRQDSVYAAGTRAKDWVKHKLVKSADVVIRNPQRRFKDNGVVSHGNANLEVRIETHQDPQPWLVKGRRRSNADLNTEQDKKGKSAAELGWVYAPREWLPVGAASLIGKDLSIADGDVVEVLYLYQTEDLQIIQPRIVRKRDDKTAAECDLAQFPPYTRAIAWDGPTYPVVIP